MAIPAASRPPDLDAEIERWVLDNPAQLRLLRRSLHDSIDGAPVAQGQTDKMLIVATELASNALKYGRPPTIVRLCRMGRDYVIDVIDHDPTTQLEEPSQHRRDSSGLGLALSRALALDVGWYATSTTKHVWARFPG